MKEGISYFFLGFFSDKTLKKAGNRNYLNILLSFVLAMMFVYCGVLLGFTVPFNSLYNRSYDFRNFLYEAFSEGNGIEINIENNYAKSNVIVNTFDNEEDNKLYEKSGYTLVIDTRSSESTYDDFEAYCISNDGKNTEITYEDYLTLSDVAKLNFDFKIRYTGRELKLTDELTDKYKSYLDSITEESIVLSYNELKSQTLSQTEFNRKLYSLYVKAYYPDISAYETSSDVPLLHTYYYQNFLNTDKNIGKYFFVFDYSCMAAFETDRGVSVSFGGFYTKLGKTVLTGSTDGIDAFIKGTYNASNELNFYIIASGLMSMFPFMFLVWLLCLILFYFISKFDRLKTFKDFGICAKVVANFVLWGGLFAAIGSFISGFFVARENLFNVALAIFFLTIVVRMIVLLICEHIRERKIEEINDKKEEIPDGGE